MNNAKSLKFFLLSSLYSPLIVEHGLLYSFVIRIRLLIGKLPNRYRDVKYVKELPQGLITHHDLIDSCFFPCIVVNIVSLIFVLALSWRNKTLFQTMPHVLIVLVAWIWFIFFNPFLIWFVD